MKQRLKVMRAIFGSPPTFVRCDGCIHRTEGGRCRKAIQVVDIDSRRWPGYWRGCGAFEDSTPKGVVKEYWG
jgi:hypothetical protein